SLWVTGAPIASRSFSSTRALTPPALTRSVMEKNVRFAGKPRKIATRGIGEPHSCSFRQVKVIGNLCEMELRKHSPSPSGRGRGSQDLQTLRPHPARFLIRRGFAAPKRAGLSQRERYQNRSFSANWICREGVAV